MSFWPFLNNSSNSSLQKYLDTVQDILKVTVDDLLNGSEILEDLVNELNNIKDSYNQKLTSSFQLSSSANTTSHSADSISLSSSVQESNSKDDQGTKLIELLIQPHILLGLLDLLIASVDFYETKRLQDDEKLEELIRTSPDKSLRKGDSDEQQADKNRKDQEEIDSDDSSSDSSDEETDDSIQSRKIESASNILQCDLWIILNRIIETPLIMSKLWSILSLPLNESSPTVNHIINILTQLISTNNVEFLNFIRKQDNLVDIFINKIEIPSIMEFFLNIIQSDKQDSPTGIIETLSDQNIIMKLIDLLKPDESQFESIGDNQFPNSILFFKQAAATDFLKNLVTISANTALAVTLETNIGPNDLTRELVSPKIIQTMISDIMLFKDHNGEYTNKHGINNCVGIIIELIRKNNSDYDLNCGSYTSMLQNSDSGSGEVNAYVMFQWLKDFEENPPGSRDPIYLGDMLEIFSNHLNDFGDIIDIHKGPTGASSLGFTNFKLSELIAELLHCSNMILLNSKRIKKIIAIRDEIRLQQVKRIKKALNESISFSENFPIEDVTSGLDDVSLDNFDGSSIPPCSQAYTKVIELIENEIDSDDEEPLISADKPFVCDERNRIIRENPCVGDYFKIKLIDLDVLLRIVSKFTQFPWHNFFHNVVFDLIQQIFNGKLNSYNSYLIVDLFKSDRCNLVDLIVKLYKDNTEPRPGYMGHLILISEEVVKFTSLYKPDLISPIIVDAIQSDDWEWFVKDVLYKTRQVYNVVLGADQERSEDGEFGYDTSTVGYLNLDNYENNSSSDKNVIILGDSANHDLFINEESKDEDELIQEEGAWDVNVQSMNPAPINHDKPFDNDLTQYEGPDPNKELADSLFDSSSSSDEENDIDEDDHSLRRFTKHE